VTLKKVIYCWFASFV